MRISPPRFDAMRAMPPLSRRTASSLPSRCGIETVSGAFMVRQSPGRDQQGQTWCAHRHRVGAGKISPFGAMELSSRDARWELATALPVMAAGDPQRRSAMKTLLISAAALLTAAVVTPAFAQIAVDTPVGGVRIGEPGYRHYRDHDRPVIRERRIYRERGVRLNCRTVTIERDDGSMRRIRRCD